VRIMESKQQPEIRVTLMRTRLSAFLMRASEERILAARMMKENEAMKMVRTMTPMKKFTTVASALSIG